MNRPKLHVKKGDLVRIITGENKGVEGTILKVIPKKSRVFVEGASKLKKAVRPSQQHPQGGFIDIDRPIHISNVKKVDGDVKKPAAKKAATKKAAKKAASKKSVE